MNKSIKIKVIKKDSLKHIREKKRVIEIRDPQDAERRLVSTVSDWITDFQERRYEEKKRAFRLFRTSLKIAPAVSTDAA